MRQYISRRAALLGATVAFALSVPLAVFASHQFTDVPNSNLFHADIDALVDSGVTSGCAANRYCPNANVTRGQMAAFLNRLGALAPGKTPVVNATKLDGLDSSAFLKTGTIVTSIDGSGWLAHNTSPTTVQRFLTNTRFSGDGVALLPLVAPSQVSGVSYGLASLQICYATSGGGFIDQLNVYRTNSAAVPTAAYVDNTNRTTSGCYSVAPNAAAQEGMGLALILGGGAAARVTLLPAETTWSSTGTFSQTSEDAELDPALVGN
jgi:hypothetical protein